MGSRLHGNDGGRRRTPHGRRRRAHIVIPATAGIQGGGSLRWVPVYTGTTVGGGNDGSAAGMTGTGPAPAPFMPLPLLGYSMSMAGTRENLTAAVEGYLSDLRRVRASGGATGERSYYPPLSNLLNAVGGTLKPRVFCVGELAEQGAGHPDFGLYAARQTQRGRLREGQAPERGVVEVKPADDDAWLTASGEIR